MTSPINLAITSVKKVDILEKVLQILLDFGANINEEDSSELTPILCACRNNEKIAFFLLENGASIDALGPECLSPLIFAVSHGLYPLASFLLKKGANINHITNECDALTVACFKNRVDFVKFLLENGANVDNCRDCLIINTAGSTEVEIMKMIFGKIGIDAADKNGNTALIHCAKKNWIDQAKKLLSLGANVNLRNNDGSTPLHIATSGNKIEFVRLLLDAKANIDTVDVSYSTPLADSIARGYREIFDMLVESGASTILYNGEEMCDHLLLACSCERKDMIETLVDGGADLHFSAGILIGYREPPEIFKYLAEKCEKPFLMECLKKRLKLERNKGLNKVVSNALKVIIRKK